MEKHKQPINRITALINFVKETWKPVLWILFGMITTLYVSFFGIIYFSVADFVNPVVRIETILQTDFPSEKILDAYYSRGLGEDDEDIFEIVLIMNQSEFDDLCDGSYEWAKEHQYTNFQAHCWAWNDLYLFGHSIRIEKKDFNLYELHIYGELNPRCNSTNMFTPDSPCF